MTNSADPDLDPIAQNTETMLAFEQHEQGAISRHQQLLEKLSEIIGSSTFLVATIFFVVMWVLANLLARQYHHKAIDLPPFPILQGLLGLGAILSTIIVLIKQNRMSKMEERRAHLEFQVNLLTEQKVTKLINLIEELRHDLPMIKDRYDAQAVAYQVPTDPEAVLKALDDRKES